MKPTLHSDPTRASGGRFRWLLKLAVIAGWCGLALLNLWATAALYFDVRVAWLRVPLALAFGLGLIAIFVWVKRRWLAMGFCAGGFLVVLGWWCCLSPSNQRDWQPDLALLPYAEFAGNKVTIHNVRDCEYRTETDFTVRHYDQTFDLEKLQRVDLFLVYWGSPHMAHTMVSFGFEGDEYVCFSIETRKEKGEGYSAVKGLFRQFELTYIIASERDAVRLRTNYRTGEDAYLYPIRMTPEQGRNFLRDYLRRANELHERPEWYNALTDNCTTAIRTQRAAAERVPWDWRMLVNGHLDELLYEHGAITTNFTFAEIKHRSLINPQAKLADPEVDFSRRIRQDLPAANP